MKAFFTMCAVVAAWWLGWKSAEMLYKKGWP